MITLGSDRFRVVLDERQGGEIIHLGPAGENVLAHYDWASPVPSSRSSSYDAGGPLDWLSSFRAGWQCLVPNAGDSCVVNGVPLPFHGEWSRTRVDVSEAGTDEVVLRSGLRLPLVAERRIRVHADRGTVRVQTTLRNEGPSRVPYVWGEHPAFDLSPGARIYLPADRIEVDRTPPGSLSDLVPGSQGQWPSAEGVDGTVDLSIVPLSGERFCYLVDMPEAWAVAVDGDRTIGMAWDRSAFPHAWLWQERGGTGFPWFGRAAITAIEPAAHWPSTNGLAGAVERQQARWLEPGDAASSWTTISVSASRSGTPTTVHEDGTIEYEGA